jgi:carbamoyl-phosphate synthase small subunit
LTPDYAPSQLVLENGSSFSGFSPTWQHEHCEGEVVFTTGMTGYPESLTDPSFAGQILVFTYPLVGNYGFPPPSQWESNRSHVRGVVMGEACAQWSHREGTCALLDWLQGQRIGCITGIDTRRLTKILRAAGTMRGAIGASSLTEKVERHWVSQVSTTQKETHGNGAKRVIAVDCGMKAHILRELTQLKITVLRVPYNYDYTHEEYDGVFLSNGPGDPTECQETIAVLKKAMKKEKPIFGICLGAQILALAADATTYKLPFGHRGQNQPCVNLATRRCYMTSQNHGYAVDARSLSREWEVTFKNLNDGSVEGISHKEKPFFAVQFHPEATPGPTDTRWLFEQFYQSL